MMNDRVDQEATHAWAEGVYRHQTWRFARDEQEVPLRLRPRGLAYRDGQGWRELRAVRLHADRVLLREPGQNRATAVLLRVPDGSVYLIDERVNLRQTAPASRSD